ncbi:MAG: DUF411 domain-containing protein [Alphaproteobacteria bacterium]|nr:DUF411 domain-containing protein [Alphaproteobacteria bacterium]
MNRRNIIAATVALVVTTVSRRISLAATSLGKIDVMRNPGCNCCEKWSAGLKAAGFDVNMSDSPDLEAYRKSLGVPADLAGCHTGKIDGYIVEGHVPPAEIIKMLRERPKAAGLAVSGMPMGSPGMEMEGHSEPYDVMLFKGDGSRVVFAKY